MMMEKFIVLCIICIKDNKKNSKNLFFALVHSKRVKGIS